LSMGAAISSLTSEGPVAYWSNGLGVYDRALGTMEALAAPRIYLPDQRLI